MTVWQAAYNRQIAPSLIPHTLYHSGMVNLMVISMVSASASHIQTHLIQVKHLVDRLVLKLDISNQQVGIDNQHEIKSRPIFFLTSLLVTKTK